MPHDTLISIPSVLLYSKHCYYFHLCLIYNQCLLILKLSGPQARACWQRVRWQTTARRVQGIWDALTFRWPLKTFRQGTYWMSAMIYVLRKSRTEETIPMGNNRNVLKLRGRGGGALFIPNVTSLVWPQRSSVDRVYASSAWSLEIMQPKFYWKNIANKPRKPRVQRVNVRVVCGPLTSSEFVSVL